MEPDLVDTVVVDVHNRRQPVSLDKMDGTFPAEDLVFAYDPNLGVLSDHKVAIRAIIAKTRKPCL